ncbi:hypothetical protein B0H14DRAFT_2592618 [Mycena olivaceomarginata]|nr:hypothetical protein B0H14DRAFT_2592618 [Mycena olivaceomarginata]
MGAVFGHVGDHQRCDWANAGGLCQYVKACGAESVVLKNYNIKEKLTTAACLARRVKMECRLEGVREIDLWGSQRSRARKDEAWVRGSKDRQKKEGMWAGKRRDRTRAQGVVRETLHLKANADLSGVNIPPIAN